MVLKTRRNQPSESVIDVLEISSSEPEDDIGPLSRQPTPPRKPLSSVKPSTTTERSANGRQRLGRKAAPFPLVSPPPSDHEEGGPQASNSKTTKAVPKSLKTTMAKSGPSASKVIEISDSSSDDELVRPQTTTLKARRAGDGKGKGKERAIDVDVESNEDDEDEEPLFLPESQPTPSKRRAAPLRIPSSPPPPPLPIIDDFHDDYADFEDLWADDEAIGPVAGPVNNNEAMDVDDPLLHVPPVPNPGNANANASIMQDRRAQKRRRDELEEEEPEPSQGPTPPAQNPTPPPALPGAAQVRAANDRPSTASSDYEFDHLDPEQLEAIVIAAEADDDFPRAGPARQPPHPRQIVDVDALTPPPPRGNADPDANPIDVDAEVENPPEPEPAVEEDPRTKPVARILEIIPDVDPDHLLALVEEHLPTYGPSQIVEFLVSHLFENPGYPKVVKGKGKERAEGSGTKRKSDGGVEGGAGGGKKAKRPRIDYASTERDFTGGYDYNPLALDALQTAFPYIPLPYIRRELSSRKGLYAPTHLYLLDEERRVEREGEVTRRYQRKSLPYRGGKDKGKGRALNDEVFDEERRWLEGYLADPTANADGDGSGEAEEEEEGQEEEDDDDDDDDLEDDGTFIECGCCFSKFPFERMTQCPDAHLFCRSCLRAYASSQLGSQNVSLACMHTSGCTLQFPESELDRLLPRKLLGLYNRLKQQKELKEANIEGLEECPFCDWACVMDVPPEQDKLFRCGNEEGGCGIVSCRLCKKKEHTPRTCKEVEDDKFLDKRLRIEEAMTEALMRKCPKCSKSFIKEHGCNKMTCPHCRTLSCYICRKIINGYDHFHQNNPGQPGGSSTNTKCPLWDVSLDQRHDQEVKDAYKKAVEEVQRENPEVEIGKDIKVDLPKSPPKPAPGALPPGYIDPARMGIGGGMGFGALGGFVGMRPLQPPALPPVPAHLDLHPLRNEINQIRQRLHRARRLVGDAENRLRAARMHEDDLREATRKFGLAPTDTTGAGGVRRNRRRSDKVTRQNLSDAAVQVATQQVRVANARQEEDRALQDLLRTEQRLADRERDQQVWRNQQLIRNQEMQAEQDRALQFAREREVERERERLLAMERIGAADEARRLEQLVGQRRAMIAEERRAREARNRAPMGGAEVMAAVRRQQRNQPAQVGEVAQRAVVRTPEARTPQPAVPARRTRQRNRK